MDKDEQFTSLTDLSAGNNNGDEEISECEALAVDRKSTSSDIQPLENSRRPTGSFSASSLVLIIAINAANFVNGLYMSVPGPTLLYLADNVSADVSSVSTILAGRSAGNLLGAFAATVVTKHRTRYWNSSMKLGLSFVIYGVAAFIIPFIRELWLLVVILSVGGFLFGFNNTGFIATQLDIWGEKKSRPLMQLYQGVYSAGAMLSPLMASPFLNMAAEENYSKSDIPACLRVNNDTNSSEPKMYLINVTERNEVIIQESFNPVSWVYVIIGCLSLSSAVFLILLSLGGIEDGARGGQVIISEARKEEPLKKVALLLFFVTCFYAFQVAAVNVFASYIYSVAYCSELRFSIFEASSLNSVYWGVIILGRLLAFLVASKMRPSTLITTCVGTLLTSTVLMSVFGESHHFVAWSATALWAFGISPLFGAGVSWVSKITNVSGKYAVIFELGSAFGAIGAFPVAGTLFDMNPYLVIYFVSVLIGLLALSYLGMLLTARARKAKTTEDARRIIIRK